MLINYRFTARDGRVIEGRRTRLDRNYADESAALVLIENEKSTTGGYFELNLRKDERGRLTGGGYVTEYDSTDDPEPSYIDDANVIFDVTQHAFDDAVMLADNTLRAVGKRIDIGYEDGYWSVGVCDLDGSHVKIFASGYTAEEVDEQDMINECVAYYLEWMQHPKNAYTQKHMENAVMLAASLYQHMYDKPNIEGGAIEVAGIIIREAVAMEEWITANYGADDDCYLDRVEEYEKHLTEKYDLHDEDAIGEEWEDVIIRCSEAFSEHHWTKRALRQVAEELGIETPTK